MISFERAACMTTQSKMIVTVSILAALGLSACVKPKGCEEPEAPYVLPEGTYSKFGDPNIMAREDCVVPPPVQPLLSNLYFALPGEPAVPAKESFPQPDTFGFKGAEGESGDNDAAGRSF
jgi:hypothetical protein